MLLPEVETVPVTSGALGTEINADSAEFTYTGLQNINAGGDWPVKNVTASVGTQVHAGDPLLQIDVTSLKLQTERLRASLLQLEDQAKAGSSPPLDAQIEIAKQELQAQQAGYPADGVVRSPCAGTVWECDAWEGETVSSGKTAVSLVTKASVPSVQWTLSAQAGDAFQDVTGAAVTVQYLSSSTASSANETVYIKSRRFDAGTGEWTLTAPLNLKTVPGRGDLVSVQMSDEQKTYPRVVPASCVRESDGVDYLLTVSQRQGYFSEENYLTQMNVMVLAKNDLYVAVSGQGGVDIPVNTQVVEYSSKAVNEGDVVTVRSSQ